jgi:hypothetical protein
MTQKTKALMVAAGTVSLISVLAFAGDFKGHPNLKKAHNKVDEAIHHLEDAKNGVTGDPFGGHRDNAENLLRQALSEIDQAGQFAEAHPAGH